MNESTDFAIIGSGNIASTYVKAVENIDNAAVTAIVSRTGKKPAGFPDLKSYSSLEEIKEKFDAVIICTPNGFHHSGAVEAAEMGKHVLCEKPIDITLTSIDRMIASCRNNHVKLGVAYQRRFSSDNPAIKKLITRGKLGKIFSVDLGIRNFRDETYYNSAPYRGTWKVDGGGPFMQQASHYIDLYQWYFGRPAQLASKLDTFVHDIEVEDHGAVLCVHDSGMISTITASTATRPGFPARMEIYSDRGWVRLENDRITHWDIEGLENPAMKNSGTEHTGSSGPQVEDTTNHELVIRDFIDAIRSGRDPLVTGESARVTTEIILDIYKHHI